MSNRPHSRIQAGMARAQAGRGRRHAAWRARDGCPPDRTRPVARYPGAALRPGAQGARGFPAWRVRRPPRDTLPARIQPSPSFPRADPMAQHAASARHPVAAGGDPAATPVPGDARPRLRVRVVPGAGHSPAVTQPVGGQSGRSDSGRRVRCLHVTLLLRVGDVTAIATKQAMCLPTRCATAVIRRRVSAPGRHSHTVGASGPRAFFGACRRRATVPGRDLASRIRAHDRDDAA
jgi:hypothetical protein